MYTITLQFESDKDREILSEIIKHKDEETFIKDILYKALIEDPIAKVKSKQLKDMFNDDNFWKD